MRFFHFNSIYIRFEFETQWLIKWSLTCLTRTCARQTTVGIMLVLKQQRFLLRTFKEETNQRENVISVSKSVACWTSDSFVSLQCFIVSYFSLIVVPSSLYNSTNNLLAYNGVITHLYFTVTATRYNEMVTAETTETHSWGTLHSLVEKMTRM